MKSKMLFLFVLLSVAAVFSSCSDDDDPKVKGDPDLAHEGDKWNIASADYMLIDQTTSSQTVKSGTKANAGSFYFVNGGDKGSFEMNIEGYNKEDVFIYTIDGSTGDVTIVDIEQNVGVTTNQNILVISGESTATTMTLDGTITKQSTTGQFVLTVTLTLEKI